MDKVLLLIGIFFLMGFNYSPFDTILKGIVLDESREPIIGAKVQVLDTTLYTITNIDGKFEIELPVDHSHIEVSYIAYKTKLIHIKDSTFIEVKLETSSALLEEVLVGKSMKGKLCSFSLTSSPEYSSIGINVHSPKKAGEIRIRGISSHDFVDDGIAFSSPTISSGQITAGEWNDLDNWEDWKNLLENPDYKEMQDHWSLFPKKRYSVFVTNKYEYPVPGCIVLLLDKNGHQIWKAKTDHSGKAELWEAFSDTNEKANSIQLNYGSRQKSISDIHEITKGVNHIVIDQACQTRDQVNIAFVVDATGSMGDEIAYLQSELLDVMNRTESLRSDLQFNYASIFYRDHTDSYLTKQQDFTTKAEQVLGFIQSQRAGGGGDYPEAVDEALDKALQLNWNEKAMTSLLFLILDAPPHHQADVLNRLNDQIRKAAALGIKIIPITASGINRQTEFLMKFMAIATNGTYVFITDDSGIGNPHLDPVVEDYEVEYLNDLMIRLIENYTKTNPCNNSKQLVSHSIHIYPNPTSNYVNIELEQEAKAIKILSSSGKLIRNLGEKSVGKSKIYFENLISGVYTLQFVFDDRIESKQVILVNG